MLMVEYADTIGNSILFFSAIQSRGYDICMSEMCDNSQPQQSLNKGENSTQDIFILNALVAEHKSTESFRYLW